MAAQTPASPSVLPITTTTSSSSSKSTWSKTKPYLRGTFVGLIALNVGCSFYRQWKAWKELVTLPEAFFLELDLEQSALVERSSSSPLSLLRAAAGREIELHKLIKVLQAAKADERVRGLLAILGDRANFGGMAQLQELRNSLLDFRFHVQGRAPVYAYSNAFCEGGSNGTGLYYVASAADRVFMPPTGMVSLLGFASSQVFVKGLLDRFKVQPEVFRREEYKSALAPLTGAGYDAPHRANLESLLGSLYDQVVQGIASARRITPAAVESAVNTSPLLASQAMQHKLLDGLLYRDQVEALMLQQLPAKVQQQQQQPLQVPTGSLIAAAHKQRQLKGPRVSLHRYSLAEQWEKALQQFWGGPLQPQADSSSSSSSTPGSMPQESAAGGANPEASSTGAADSTAAAVGREPGSGPGTATNPRPSNADVAAAGNTLKLLENRPVVAVVTAAGAIMQSSSGPGADGASVVESNKLVRVLRAYRDNPQVKAVVLRINSPGGSAVASDMIAREVALLREGGKPVVACMGDVAASGGYYIAAPCNKILAQPGTITGSIGVIFMKLNIKEALLEYGVTGDVVSCGDNADWASGLHSLTPKQQQQLDGMISATYDDFMSAVARGRGLSKEAVREVAKGRVWSGSQAMEVGLVDEVGGLLRAVDVAKQLAGLPMHPDATMLQEWPPSRVPPVVKLLQAAGGMDGTPLEAAAAAEPSWWHSVSSATPAAAVAAAAVAARAGAAAELASLLWDHAAKPAWLGWVPQGLLEGQTAASIQQQQQQVWQAHPAVAAAGAAGVQQQLVSVLGYLGQQHNQPDMYCMEAEQLARCC